MSNSSFSAGAETWLNNGQSQTNGPSNSSIKVLPTTFSSGAQGWLSTNTGKSKAPVVQPTTKPVDPYSQITPVAKLENKVVQGINNLPEAHFADKANFFTPMGFVKSIAQGLINTPAEAAKGAASLGTHIGQGNSTPQQVAGDLAAAVQLPLLFLTGGAAKAETEVGTQVVKNTASTIIKNLAKAGIKESAIGGGFGGLAGLQSGKNINNTSDYLKNLLQNVGIGAAAGPVAGAALHTAGATIGKVVVPLAKGLSEKLGAVFVKNADKTPQVDHIQVAPEVAQSVVLSNNLENKPVGKALLKTAGDAKQQDAHVAITPSDTGKYTVSSGNKVDVSVVKPYVPTSPVDTFEKNIKDYQSFGGYTAGSETENAALRDIGKVADTPEVKQYTQDKVQAAIKDGTIKPDANGDITLYRGGEASTKNDLISASYDKSVAQTFVDEAKTQGKEIPMHEIKVKPEDIKAFIGKAEGEVLLKKDVLSKEPAEKNPVTTEQLPKEEKSAVTQQFDKNGKEIQPKGNKKVLTGNEVRAIRDVMEAKLQHIRETAGNEKEYGKEIDKLVSEVKDKAQGDKAVLSALRTELNKEMFGIAGAGGNYKEAYASLMGIRENDPAMGGLIDKIDNHIKNLDDTLLSTPDNKTRPAFVQEKLKKAGEQTGEPTNQLPVGTGKQKTSKAYEHTAERLLALDPERFKDFKDGQPFYNVAKAQVQAEKAAEFIHSSPQEAFSVAMGYKNPPEGLRPNDVSIALSDRAREEGNDTLMAKVETAMSLRSTREGQDIAALRGRGNDNSAHAFIQQVMSQRLNKIGKSGLTDLIDTTKKAVGKKVESVKERAVARIDAATERLQKELKRQQVKIKSAQDLLDQLTCK